jgi:hypothetical protein
MHGLQPSQNGERAPRFSFAPGTSSFSLEKPQRTIAITRDRIYPFVVHDERCIGWRGAQDVRSLSAAGLLGQPRPDTDHGCPARLGPILPSAVEASVADVKAWLRLGDALSRVMEATGVTEEQAKHHISGAITDGKIRIRFALFQPFRGLVHHAGGDPHDPWIPKHLRPDDLDWSNSRPRMPWPPRAAYRDPLYTISEWRERWLVIWLELLMADVVTVLCAVKSEAQTEATATARDESAAIRALALKLRANRDFRRDDAATWCRTQGFKVSGRGFQQRVWPQARAKADLEARAPAGRKRTSLR